MSAPTLPAPPLASRLSHSACLADYAQAFAMAPVGLVISHYRSIIDCNEHLERMFMCSRELLRGQSFRVLYPSVEEFENTGKRVAAVLSAGERYADERIMQRANGELFWCHVSGCALSSADPHASGIWSFEDVSARRPVRLRLTGREREVASFLLAGHTSKTIALRLGISPRTVQVFRARLMKKMSSHTTADLVHKLLHGADPG